MTCKFEELLRSLTGDPQNVQAFETCFKLIDFSDVNYDVDSLHIIGKKNLSWLKPILNFTCPLKSINASPCMDKKLTSQLIQKISYEDSLKCGLNTARTRPEIRYRKEIASWFTFELGATGLETVRVYALILNETNGQFNKIVGSYRKIFFENYILKSLNKILSEGKNRNSFFSHTSMANASQIIPSDGSLRLYPDSWDEFTKEIDRCLKHELPPFTVELFFGLSIHGLKNDWNLMAEHLSKRVENLINFNDSSPITLMQFHLAVTLKSLGQLVIADKTKLSELSKVQDVIVYKKFCLNKDLVYFTTNKLKNPNFSQVTYTQFYPENWHILLKDGYGSRACFFLNAALGLNGVGGLEEGDVRECESLPDLNGHIHNIKCWCRKLRSCIGSIKSGTVGRLESVFTITEFGSYPKKNVKSLLIDNDTFLYKHLDKSMQLFQSVVNYFIENGVIIRSIGSWWKNYVEKVNDSLVEPLIGQVMIRKQISPLTTSEVKGPLTRAELKRIYDLEQLLMIWIDETGRGLKPVKYDLSRVDQIFDYLKSTKSKKLKLWQLGTSTNRGESISKKTRGQAEKINLLENVTDLMIVAITKNDESIHQEDFIIQAIHSLETSEKKNIKWFNPRSITVRGYPPCIAKYCDYMIYCSPLDSVQRDQLLQYPTFNLMSCYEVCVAMNWGIKVEENECVFSRAAFKRTLKEQKLNKMYKLMIDPSVATSQDILNAILKPPTAFGKIILNRTFGLDGIENLKSDAKFELCEFIKKKIKVFPKYLVEPKVNYYYKWQIVEEKINA